MPRTGENERGFTVVVGELTNNELNYTANQKNPSHWINESCAQMEVLDEIYLS